jgi:hypothetical protein
MVRAAEFGRKQPIRFGTREPSKQTFPSWSLSARSGLIAALGTHQLQGAF